MITLLITDISVEMEHKQKMWKDSCILEIIAVLFLRHLRITRSEFIVLFYYYYNFESNLLL